MSVSNLCSKTIPLELSIDYGRVDDVDLFFDILQVRNEVYKLADFTSLIFPFDKYSDQYRLSLEDRPSGCLTVTRALEGEIDCSEYYPEALLETFHEEIVSALKFRILNTVFKDLHAHSRMLSSTLVRTAWQDQLNKGARLDLINVERSYIPYYRRMGYHLIEDSNFTHPTLGTDSYCMFLPADPNSKSIAQDLFQQADRPLYLDEVQRVLTRVSVPVRAVQGN